MKIIKYFAGLLLATAALSVQATEQVAWGSWRDFSRVGTVVNGDRSEPCMVRTEMQRRENYLGYNLVAHYVFVSNVGLTSIVYDIPCNNAYGFRRVLNKTYGSAENNAAFQSWDRKINGDDVSIWALYADDKGCGQVIISSKRAEGKQLAAYQKCYLNDR